MVCKHSEGFIERKDTDTRKVVRIPVEGHDCAYVDARNALIPAAERKAEELALQELRARGMSGGMQNPSYGRVFTQHFMAEMNARCRKAGLIK